MITYIDYSAKQYLINLGYKEDICSESLFYDILMWAYIGGIEITACFYSLVYIQGSGFFEKSNKKYLAFKRQTIYPYDCYDVVDISSLEELTKVINRFMKLRSFL